MPRVKPQPALPQEIPFGMIIIPSQPASPLPLEKTTITGQITGPLASIAITQAFTNPLTKPLELEYLFPIPHKASVTDFEIRIADRIIRGDLREVEQARQAYEKAISNGQQAALLEERRPNLFAVRLANIRPAEPILASIRYQESLNYREGEYELVIPMGLTPKFTSPDHPQESTGVTAPVALPGEKIGPVEISIGVDAGVSLADPTSPSHRLSITRLDERRLNLSLSQPYIPDHDFVLRLPVAQSALKLASYCSPHAAGDVFLATLLPPALLESAAAPSPREFIFVLDRSGSMSGEPISQARNALRACLRTLNLTDTFAILLFDNDLEWFKPASSPVTQANIDAADQFLAGVEGRGGTEIIPAIQASLAIPRDVERTRFVVFLTDGAVSADERAISEVRRRLGDARFFTFGIGPSVNRALLQKLASIGRGTCEFLQLSEDIEGAIMRFQDRVSFPVLTNLKVEYRHAKFWDTYPSILPDVYSGTPLQLVGRIQPTSGKTPRIILRGVRQGQPVEMAADLVPLSAPEPAVLRAWAKARIDDLEEQAESMGKPFHQIRDEIIGLALEHRLVTRFTAFVAIDSAQVNPDGKPMLLMVSQPLPEGLDPSGFGIAPPIQYASMSMPIPSAPVRNMKMRHLAEQSDEAFISADSLMASDVPSFLRVGARGSAARPSMPPAQPELLPVDQSDPESTLRWLARTQNLDGSWSAGAEFTALALLFMVRNGCTHSLGHYRTQVKRAAHWLGNTDLLDFPAFLAALALHELASRTNLYEHLSMVSHKVYSLPKPSTPSQEAALALVKSQKLPVALPASIASLDDLRLARLCGSTMDCPAALLSRPDADLARLWSALPV